jgi:hypothetical protein
MPWAPWPQTCLAPQYQPSQLSGLRTWEGETAQVLQQHAGVAVGRIQGLALPVSVTLQEDGIDAVGLVHPPDFAGDELAGLFPGDALVFTFAPVVGIAVAVGIPVHPLEGVLDPVRGVDAFFVGQ